MQDDSSRNTIIFLVCALVLFIVYQTFVLGPQQKRREAELKAHPPAAAAQLLPGAPSLTAPPAVTRAAALAASPRVPLAAPALKGSISLRGGRLDDLFLTQYKQTTDKNSRCCGRKARPSPGSWTSAGSARTFRACPAPPPPGPLRKARRWPPARRSL
jgi:hypothetical protein